MNSKKIVLALIALMVAVSLLAGCQSQSLVIKDSETCIVLKVTQEALGDIEEMTLAEYMNKLTQEGKLQCNISDGMVTSINGIDNPTDLSSCWMLYTSDSDNANSAWGTVEYDGQTYGSAISGANTLIVKPDQLYIWVFQSFG